MLMVYRHRSGPRLQDVPRLLRRARHPHHHRLLGHGAHHTRRPIQPPPPTRRRHHRHHLQRRGDSVTARGQGGKAVGHQVSSSDERVRA